MPCDVFLTEMEAPTTAAPEGSETVPIILAVFCANAAMPVNNTRGSIQGEIATFFDISQASSKNGQTELRDMKYENRLCNSRAANRRSSEAAYIISCILSSNYLSEKKAGFLAT